MVKRDEQPLLPGMEDEQPDEHRPTEIPTVEQLVKDRFKPAGAPQQPPESLQGAKVYVVDTHSLIYQLFHAMPEMTSPRGEPVAAVYGFARDILFLLLEKKPDYLFCAVDLPGKTFRHEIYEPYKANRPEVPDELVPQIDAIYELIDAFSIPLLGCEGYEADDVMATVADIVAQHGGFCYLVTGDKDCRQLLSERVFLYNIRKDRVFDVDALEREWGIRPEQVVDFQALVGDPTDNVPGVPLVGPKLAGKLLQQFGTLEGIFENADKISGPKTRQNLLEAKDRVLISRRLVQLDRSVPLAIPWQAGRISGFDAERLEALFRRFGFRSLLEKLEQLLEQTGSVQPVVTKTVHATYHLVTTAEQLELLVNRLRRQKKISIDTETTHLHPRRAKLVGISVACDTQEAWYVPVRGPKGETFLDEARVLDAFRPLLEDPAVAKIGQNMKYDLVVLRGVGIRPKGVAFDTMVASYLLEPGLRAHNLDELAKRFLQHKSIKISELIGKGRKQKRMDQVPLEQIAEYAGEDALLPLLLEPILAEQLKRQHLYELFQRIEMPLVEVLADMEYHGVRIDAEKLSELSRQLEAQLARLEEEIFDLAGERFNVASPKQLQEILFEKLRLPVQKRGRSGPSTDADVLEKLAELHPLPAKLLEHRQLAKLKSTYVDALPELINPITGRVHASFNQVVTATGRLSSSDPNLQNIPIRTELGRQIRAAFVPGHADWLLLSADYSQIELRVLAHFSGDERLCEAFAADEDIHAQVASRIYNVPVGQVTPEMRRQAKAVNFGVVYGQSAFGLAKQLKISKEEAARFIETYFATYPGVSRFLDRVLAECYRSGFVTTVLGRRRYISGVRPNPTGNKNAAERTAINTVIQGSAADLIKAAMIDIYRSVEQDRIPARMILQIHDELLFEVDRNAVDRLARLVKEKMEKAVPLRVPLKVDIKVGPNWAETESWQI